MRRLLLPLILLIAPAAPAQLVAGPWVDRAEQRIEQHRMADLEVLVLDALDRPVSGATVRVTQLRHAFPFGVVLPPEHADWLPRASDPERSLWRGISAVSLEPLSAWAVLQPDGPAVDPEAAARLDAALRIAQERGLFVRLTAAAPGDAADRPAWAVGLEGPRRYAAARGFHDDLLAVGAGRFHALDLISSGLDHPWLSPGEVRRLGQRARAAFAPVAAGGTGPPVWLGLGHQGALGLDRGGAVLPAAEGLLRAFVPADGITTPLVERDPVLPEDLERALQRLATFGVDAAVSPLEIGGPEADQPFGLEAALVLLFAEPRVREIHLGGVAPGEASSLLDTAGNPTAGGRSVDFLLADRWWTDATATTDALGVARLRVFAGKHAVAAGGEPVEVAVAAGETARIVLEK